MALKEFRMAVTIAILFISILTAMLGIVSEELDWALIGLGGMCISGYGLHIWIYNDILITKEVKEKIEMETSEQESMAVERMKMTE